jgi:hypothetical protein
MSNILENIELEVAPNEVSLDSFNNHKELNPKIFPDNKLNKKVRIRLLDIAYDFIEYLDVPFVKHKDIIIVGSITNFNWSKYSDIDLHIIYNFNEISRKKPEFVRDYFDSKKTQWNNERQVHIYGYPVELYVEDINNPSNSNGKYSIESNEWIQFPQEIPSITSDKWLIKNISAKIMTKIDDYIELYNKKEDLETLVIKVNKLWSYIKNMRKDGIKKDGEQSPFNYAFKVLRRTDYLQKLFNLKNNLYIWNKSLR